MVLTLPVWRSTRHALGMSKVSAASVVADQYSFDWTLVKGWLAGSAGFNLV
jgi:hypothetical protein